LVRIHRSHAVNLRRVREIRPVDGGGWEVRMDPPVNRVLPVSRRQASDLFAAYGEGEPTG
jgi:DNA-binding LytR/AlgR family response regulator